MACCLETGTIDRVARAYEAVLGLHRIEVSGSDEVGGADNGMRSIALTAGAVEDTSHSRLELLW